VLVALATRQRIVALVHASLRCWQRTQPQGRRGRVGPQTFDRPMEICGARRSAGRSAFGKLAEEGQRLCQGRGVTASREASAWDVVRFQGMNSGDREGGRKSSGGMVGPPEPGTSRYAVGLVIPRPVARLQSRTPLHQAKPVYLADAGRQRRSRGFSWNDGFVALKTGPGGRT
jgi:hypothetical protein